MTPNPRKHNIIVGIDPDSEKSGLAIVDREKKTGSVMSLSFPDLLDVLQSFREDNRVIVVVEDSWTKGGNWHVHPRMSALAAAKIGQNVGRCHQVGMLIVEFCRRWSIDCDPVQPLVKMWAGRDRKITHAEISEITGLEQKRTNQEERDALLLAWAYSGLPIRLSVKRC